MLMVNLMELIRIFLWFLPDTVSGHGVVLLCFVCFFLFVCFSVFCFVLLCFVQSVCRLCIGLDKETDQKSLTALSPRASLDFVETFQNTEGGKNIQYYSLKHS